MNILIFYASYGGGHYSAALSINQYILENYKNVNIKLVDCMKYFDKTIDKISTDAYKKMATSTPKIWGEIYKISGKETAIDISTNLGKLISKKIYKLLIDFKPDVVIATHFIGSQTTSYLKSKGLINCKLAVVMTDFASHNQWLIGNEKVDYFFVSHESMKNELIVKGIPEEKIFATGIPLSSRFLQNFDKDKIRKSFDISKDKKVILFFGGGEFGLGKDKTVSLLDSFIKNIGNTYQIICVSGKNKKIKEHFEELVQKRNAQDNVQVYGFSNEIPELMSIADIVVTKPGGLTATESLASGLPILIINPIPGQEIDNTRFLENQGVAIWIKINENPNNVIKNILSNPEMLSKMGSRARLLSRKNSTKDIVKIIIDNF